MQNKKSANRNISKDESCKLGVKKRTKLTKNIIPRKVKKYEISNTGSICDSGFLKKSISPTKIAELLKVQFSYLMNDSYRYEMSLIDSLIEPIEKFSNIKISKQNKLKSLNKALLKLFPFGFTVESNFELPILNIDSKLVIYSAFPYYSGIQDVNFISIDKYLKTYNFEIVIEYIRLLNKIGISFLSNYYYFEMLLNNYESGYDYEYFYDRLKNILFEDINEQLENSPEFKKKIQKSIKSLSKNYYKLSEFYSNYVDRVPYNIDLLKDFVDKNNCTFSDQIKSALHLDSIRFNFEENSYYDPELALGLNCGFFIVLSEDCIFKKFAESEFESMIYSSYCCFDAYSYSFLFQQEDDHPIYVPHTTYSNLDFHISNLIQH